MNNFYNARIETLSNVEDWNREKAANAKDPKDRERFLSNAFSVAQERGEIVHIAALLD